MTDPRIEPLELRAPEGARVLEIDWADGHRGVYSHEQMRAFCPCAFCQGHQGPIRFFEGVSAASLELKEIEEVGNYAVRLTWGDGHATGIYSFRFLRLLCECGACIEANGHLPLRERTFGR